MTDELFSREKVAALPFAMAITGYLLTRHSIARALRREDGLAYHYTNAQGLIGIVSAGRFRATNIAFLNDKSEGQYFADEARKFLKTLAVTPDLSSLAESACDRVRTGVDSSLYVTSLSLNGDLLSQWRGYGERGQGYALGFDLSSTVRCPQVATCIRMTYGFDHVRPAVADVFDIYDQYLRKNPHHLPDCIDWLGRALRLMSSGVKHPSFAEEDEVRILFDRITPTNAGSPDQWFGTKVCFHSKGADVVPYVDSPLDFPDSPGFNAQLPLREIVAGPLVPYDRNKGSISALLSANGYGDVRFRQSVAPLEG